MRPLVEERIRHSERLLRHSNRLLLFSRLVLMAAPISIYVAGGPGWMVGIMAAFAVAPWAIHFHYRRVLRSRLRPREKTLDELEREVDAELARLEALPPPPPRRQPSDE